MGSGGRRDLRHARGRVPAELTKRRGGSLAYIRVHTLQVLRNLAGDGRLFGLRHTLVPLSDALMSNLPTCKYRLPRYEKWPILVDFASGLP